MAMTRRELLLAIGSATIGTAALRISAPQPSAGSSLDWKLHNLDLSGTRFSPATEINSSNVKSLVPRWLFQHGVIDGISNQTTPTIVDGMMVVTDSRGSAYAVDHFSRA
jgi:alcohol dehydrogenase (cytochrome c)